MYGGRGYRPGGGAGLGFGPPFTPPIIKQLLITIAAVFLAQNLFERRYDSLFSVVPIAVWAHAALWQPFTYMWLHSGLGHIAMNCFALWMFGSPLAMAWGPKRFVRFYLVCGVGAGVLIATVPFLFYALGATRYALAIPTLGASGAIYGVILAYSLTWPDRTIMLIFPPVAFRAIWLIPALFFMEVVIEPGGNVSHVGHLSGVAVGWLYLRSTGDAGGFSVAGIKHRFRRWRMRQKLRAVQYEEWESKRREQDRRYH